jgi:membrane protease YdiL (CAAX protease family)
VPADFWTDAARMVTAGAIVAAVAVPVGLVAWRIARRLGEPLLPPWKPWRVPWGGFEVFFAFLVVHGIVPIVLVDSGMKPLAAGVIALPIQLGLLVLAAQLLYPARKLFRRGGYAGRVALAVAVWAILTPPVLVFYAAVLQLFTLLHWQPDEHPLTQTGAGTPAEQALFLFQVCVAAPLVEEILFRGVLLPWTIGSRERNVGRPQIAPLVPGLIRPWLVMVFAVSYAVLVTVVRGKGDPTVFAATLAAGLGVIWVSVRRGKRHVRGVYASAAFFAVVHSTIWPSPLPLFLLGLGLGWLAVRTRGVLAPAIVHGLFNAVSAVIVLRGGTG